jgi:valyl-tRNA synthetase
VEAERKRLLGEIAKIDTEIAKVGAKLADTSFVQGAPPPVIAAFHQREAEWRAKRGKLEAAMAAL